MVEEAVADIVWEGQIGKTPLRLGVLASGKVRAEWGRGTQTRVRVVDSPEQLERSVLFQLRLEGEPGDEERTHEALAAVIVAQGEKFSKRPVSQVQPKRRKSAQQRPRRPQRRR